MKHRQFLIIRDGRAVATIWAARILRDERHSDKLSFLGSRGTLRATVTLKDVHISEYVNSKLITPKELSDPSRSTESVQAPVEPPRF